MREYGRLKVLGATPKQLKRVVKRERSLLTAAAIPFGLLLAAGITLLVTLTVGTVCSLAVCHIFDRAGMFGNLTYYFPILQVLAFAAALLLVQAVFSACAVRYSRRFSLVERIKAAD